jgi:hypothetical protein
VDALAVGSYSAAVFALVLLTLSLWVTWNSDQRLKTIVKQLKEKTRLPETKDIATVIETTNKSESEPLKISDWVAFLTSEKYGSLSNLLSFAAILVTLVILIIASKSSGTLQIAIDAVIAFAFVIFSFIKVFKPFGTNADRATKTLKLIMRHDLKTEASISEYWAEINAPKKGKDKKQGEPG